MDIQSFSPNIMVKNVQQTVDFYQNLLGFTLVNSVPDQTGKQALQWAMVQAGNVTLMFQEEANLKAEYPSLAQHAVGGGFTLYLTVTNFDTLYGRAKSMTTIVKEPHKLFYGATEFALLDTNGYVLTICQAI